MNCINYINGLDKSFDLNKVKDTLDKLDYEYNFKKIAIMGDAGKTSTSLFLSSLMINKFNIGIFNTKYLNKINECIKVNELEISDESFNQLVNIINNYKDTNNINYSYYEYLFIISFLYFSDRNVEYAFILMDEFVIDFINYDLSIITNISSDKYNDYLKISSKKLAFTSDDKYYHQVWAYCIKNQLDYEYISKKEVFVYDSLMCSFIYSDDKGDLNVDLNVIGKAQAINSLLAISAYGMLVYEKLKKKKIKKLIEQVFIKGVFERVYIEPGVLIDPANTLSKVKNQIETIKKHHNIKVIYCGENIDNSIISEYEKNAIQAAFTSVDECEKTIKKAISESNKRDLIVISGDFEAIKRVRKIFR